MMAKANKNKMISSERKTANINIVLRIQPLRVVDGKECPNGK